MARKRRSRALLEVINSGKGINGRPLFSRTTNLRPASSPWKFNWRWWQRPRVASSTSDEAVAYDPSDPTTSATARAMQPSTVQDAHDFAAPVEQDIEERAPRGLPFRINATAMIVAGCAAIAGIGLVIVSGRHSSRTPPALISTENIERADPTVLDITPPAAPATRRPAEAVLSQQPSASNIIPAVQVTIQKPPTLVVQDTGRRTIGLNYVVIQSYPDEKSAIDAHDALIKNGIQVTIEKGLTGWPSTWSSVVGMTGFDKVYGSPEYDKYIKSVEIVSKKFAGSSKFKIFKPQPYKWKVTQ